MIPWRRLAGTTLVPLLAMTAHGETNSIGMNLVRIEAGSFQMGVDSVPLPKELTAGPFGVIYNRATSDGDYDETRVHTVRISRPFLIGESEVTVAQFRQFRPDFTGGSYGAPYVAGVSWDDAAAFCKWLSEKEGKAYRLPTEAEWEYACRAGTTTPFSSGQSPPEHDSANSWGVKNMHTGVAEWCMDWHGIYAGEEQTDPVGPENGLARVVRGGSFDYRPRQEHPGKFYPAEMAYYRRSSNRASMPQGFASKDGNIGFRVVQAELPATKPTPYVAPFFQTAIKQDKPDLKRGPDLSRPYFRKREMFPNLGERNMREIGWKIGLAPALGSAYHNSAVAMCDNGDLVAAYYNTLQHENDPDQTVLSMRLRYGAEEWDFPEPWPDFADAADAAPVFYNENGKLWFFFGSPRVLGGPPFWYMTSNDNGATWSSVQVPHFDGPVGEFTAQPINSVIRDRDGVMHLAVDGEGPTSVLFGTRDGGKMWFDPAGRSGGRHTTFVLGKDGSIIGFGGKDSNINGFMPRSITRDGGKTYEKSATTFSPLGGGQRPSVIRLASGRLFFVADSHSSRVQPRQFGSFVAMSDDDGQTWKTRELPNIRTVGYVTAIQAPNGVIHIVTSKTSPHLHIEMNEAWFEQGGEESPADPRSYHLEGMQTFTYATGQKQWEVTYAGGRKTGTETFWDPQGHMQWQRDHRPDGTWNWRVFDSKGQVIAESNWKGKNLVEIKTLPK